MPAAGLYQPSIHSRIALESCSMLFHVRVSSSSRCMVDQKLSTTLLSTELATRPMLPSRPAARNRCPNAQLVYTLGSRGRCNTCLVERP